MSKEKHVKVFELWIEKSGYKFFESTNTAIRGILEADAKLVWTTQAENWREAQKNKDNFLGLNIHSDGNSIHIDNAKVTVRTVDLSPVIDFIKSVHSTKH